MHKVKWNWFRFLILPLSLAILFSCAKLPPENKQPWKLVVLHQEVQTDLIEEMEGEVCVPLAPVLQAYGYEIKWQTNERATVSKDEKVYILDLSSISFYESGKENSSVNNYIGIEGGKQISVPIQKDLLANVPVITQLLRRLGENYRSDTMTDERAVYFGCRTE